MSGMKHMLRTIRTTTLLCLLLATPAGWAATVSLLPATPLVPAGGSLLIALEIDATDVGTVGDLVQGQVLIDFDPELTGFLDFMPAPGVTIGAAPLIGTTPEGQGSVMLSLFGAGISGPMGTLVFSIDAAAGATIAFGLNDADAFFGSFIIQTPTDQPFYPDFVGTSVQVIPLPAAGWLLLSALAFAARLGRLRRSD